MQSVFQALRRYINDFVWFLTNPRSFLPAKHKRDEHGDDQPFIDALLFVTISAVLAAVLEIVPKETDQLGWWIYAWRSFRSHVFPNLFFVCLHVLFVALALPILRSARLTYRHLFITHAYVYGIAVVARSMLLLLVDDYQDSNVTYFTVLFLWVSVLIALVASTLSANTRWKATPVLFLSICTCGYLTSKMEERIDQGQGYANHFSPATTYIASLLSINGTRGNAVAELGLEQPIVETLGAGDLLVDGKFQDVYRLAVQDDGTYSVNLSSSDFDAYLELIDMDDNQILAEDDDGGEGTNSLIEEQLTADGNYHLVVSTFGLATTGNYAVTLAATERMSDAAGPFTLRDCPTCPEMVVLPAGSFMMGSGDALTEQPQHLVQVKAFAAGRYEVTRGEYENFVLATDRPYETGCTLGGQNSFYFDSSALWSDPGFEQGSGDPVVCVSWHDAQAYVEWLSVTTNQDYRLLSEAEWEYVARAQTETDRYWGSLSDEPCGYANGADRAAARVFPDWTVDDCSDDAVHTAPVGTYTPNPFGLFDVLGNVWEWTEDCWHDDYAAAPVDGSAWTSGQNCDTRVLRGGSWDNHSWYLRSAARWGNPSRVRLHLIGFRVARAFKDLPTVATQ